MFFISVSEWKTFLELPLYRNWYIFVSKNYVSWIITDVNGNHILVDAEYIFTTISKYMQLKRFSIKK